MNSIINTVLNVLTSPNKRQDLEHELGTSEKGTLSSVKRKRGRPPKKQAAKRIIFGGDSSSAPVSPSKKATVTKYGPQTGTTVSKAVKQSPSRKRGRPSKKSVNGKALSPKKEQNQTTTALVVAHSVEKKRRGRPSKKASPGSSPKMKNFSTSLREKMRSPLVRKSPMISSPRRGPGRPKKSEEKRTSPQPSRSSTKKRSTLSPTRTKDNGPPMLMEAAVETGLSPSVKQKTIRRRKRINYNLRRAKSSSKSPMPQKVNTRIEKDTLSNGGQRRRGRPSKKRLDEAVGKLPTSSPVAPYVKGKSESNIFAANKRHPGRPSKTKEAFQSPLINPSTIDSLLDLSSDLQSSSLSSSPTTAALVRHIKKQALQRKLEKLERKRHLLTHELAGLSPRRRNENEKRSKQSTTSSSLFSSSPILSVVKSSGKKKGRPRKH